MYSQYNDSTLINPQTHSYVHYKARLKVFINELSNFIASNYRAKKTLHLKRTTHKYPDGSAASKG